jgi:hypothetical protein
MLHLKISFLSSCRLFCLNTMTLVDNFTEYVQTDIGSRQNVMDRRVKGVSVYGTITLPDTSWSQLSND